MLALDALLFPLLNAPADAPTFVVPLAQRVSAWGAWLAGGVALAAWLRGSRTTRYRILMGLWALAVTWCLVRAIRWGMPLPRPAQLGEGIQWIEHSARASFPSMHASIAFALAMALTLLHRRRMAAAAWALALAMAWSRVCLGVHFPSDVLAGAAVGMAGAWAALRSWPGLLLTVRGRSSAYWCLQGHPWARHT